MAKKKATKPRVKKAKSEEAELGIVETLYITDRGRLFSDNDLKRFEMPQTQQVEEQSWGKQVIKPPYDQKKLLQCVVRRVDGGEHRTYHGSSAGLQHHGLEVAERADAYLDVRLDVQALT